MPDVIKGYSRPANLEPDGKRLSKDIARNPSGRHEAFWIDCRFRVASGDRHEAVKANPLLPKTSWGIKDVVVTLTVRDSAMTVVYKGTVKTDRDGLADFSGKPMLTPAPGDGTVELQVRDLTKQSVSVTHVWEAPAIPDRLGDNFTLSVPVRDVFLYSK